MRDKSPKLSFQCSRSLGITSRTLSHKTSYQWLPPMAIFCVYRDWIQEYVTWYDAVVGLNGEFVHIVQLGANHLRGAQLLG